ncbi:hypothetical protein H257_08466 [Aphanomyces astaci]|uniref:Uncharacterized protein n=1 Tax=Aphanomyces astaci TaxID=112090 RepID=W4GEZ0_APHAT|nr:hypothetical protein H257_08466 [Aphanomyces astaci]ETV77528.1 hypothetical protein H257_08466 [Aphanomyces astaci]|eukprot:XP_009832638.1 hypothetical protein H257_08466 [Aphanomyces astaci]
MLIVSTMTRLPTTPIRYCWMEYVPNFSPFLHLSSALYIGATCEAPTPFQSQTPTTTYPVVCSAYHTHINTPFIFFYVYYSRLAYDHSTHHPTTAPFSKTISHSLPPLPRWMTLYFPLFLPTAFILRAHLPTPTKALLDLPRLPITSIRLLKVNLRLLVLLAPSTPFCR